VPFTGSHPAVVLPFLRTPLPTSALVVGSMVPDLLYYLPVDLGVPTHTARALVSTDLALGALCWLLWHGLLATPALATAPAAVRGRLSGRVRLGLRPRLTPRGLVLSALALEIGAATHVLWDEFTHRGRFGAEHVDVLARSWDGVPGYRWAQVGSSVLGVAVLAVWLARWWRATTPSPAAPGTAGWWPGLVVIGAGILAGATALPGAPSLHSAAAAAAFRGGGVALATVVLLTLAWHLRHRARPGRPAPERGRARLPGGRRARS
jgi:hypothetical protein